MSEREMSIPNDTLDTKEVITKEESDIREKVFFEEDEYISLRDGKTYQIPPLGLKEARKLMKLLNSIDTSIIIANMIGDDETDDDKFDQLMEVLHMAFKPYYKEISKEYLTDYIDLVTAKKIIDTMIGLNGLKKLM